MVRVASVNGAAGDVSEMRVIRRSAARAGPSWSPTRQKVRLSARRRVTDEQEKWEGRPERRGADPAGSIPRVW